MICYLIVVIGVFVCSASQLLLKKSAIAKHKSAIYEMLNWRVVLAYSVMFGTLITNIYALGHGVLLKDMPILGATGYIFVPLLSWLFLSEKITRVKILSLLFILVGIIIFYL